MWLVVPLSMSHFEPSGSPTLSHLSLWLASGNSEILSADVGFDSELSPDLLINLRKRIKPL